MQAQTLNRMPHLWLAAVPLAGQGLSLALAWLGAHAIPAAGRFEDLSAALIGFLLVQAVVGVACLGVTIYYLARNDRPRGLTVAGSWLTGLFVVSVVIGSLTS